ncbi:MAG TPA: tetratricopeptide repeat protein, partial [Acidimicrobiales bacterium]|jgi:tetratricopeptide (TPR) repeat protein|nr:tetratricopeptide repeat protein [Acidimicrobiales bacterium]
VSGRGRHFLAFPGVVIAAVCVVWAVAITTGGITQVSPNAIDLTAQGQQLQASGDPKSAIDKYRAAVSDSPQFGAAYARLADAEFQAGGSALAGGQFQSISDRDATRRAIDAGEKAISLGEGDASLLSDIGFYHFTLGEYDRAENLSQQALSSNDQFPPLVFNLGVVQVARGESDAAAATYRQGIDLLAKEQDNTLRLEVISAARTDLELAETETPGTKDLAQKMKGLLAVAEAPLLDSNAKVPDHAPSGSSAENITIATDRFRVYAKYDAKGFGRDASLVNVWYFRPLDAKGQGAFEQTYPLDQVTIPNNGAVTTFPTENGDCLPGGDYRVDVYNGPDLVGTGDQSIPDSPLGTLVVAGGEDAGFSMCHPESWKPLDVTGQPGSLAFANPDNAAESVVALNFPVGAATGTNPSEFLTAFIGNVLEQQHLQTTGPPLDGEELLGRTADGADVSLATTSITAADAKGDLARITGSAGTDGVVRVVIVSANSADRLDLLRGELVNSVRFLRVPNPSQ